MKHIIPHYKVNNQNKHIVGNKAFNLHLLENYGFNIPKWIVIPVDKYLASAAYINNADFMNVKIDEGLLQEISGFFGLHNDIKRFAVRSSAIEEDSINHSFAGQFETFLNVRHEDLEENIIRVWKSATSERVKTYRKNMGLSSKAGIAVIVQEIVDADVSGVGFGIDPVTGNKNCKVITSAFGLGEAIVSGKINADTYRVNGKIHNIEIADKSTYFGLNEKGGLEKRNLDKPKRLSASLAKSQIKELSEVLDKLEIKLNAPQDIEFSYSNNELYLLQTRPVTITNKTETIIWDNSNIIESYPGVTTPLTYSFISKMYESAYKQFVQILGVSRKVLKERQEIFENTLGLIRGRVYYNLLNWYKMLALLPGYSINAPFMENMMGVKERFELNDEHRMGKGKAWMRILVMLIKMLRLQVLLPRHRKQFKKLLDSVLEGYNSIDFYSKTPKELVGLYLNFEQKLITKWKPPLTNDFFSMIWFGLLQKQCRKYLAGYPNIHNDLLCGSSDIISTEPIHSLMKIASTILADNKACKLFKKKGPEQIYKAICTGEFKNIKQLIEEYINKFGDRCIGELKLESISYSQDPLLLIQTIKTYVTQNIITEKSNSVDQELRKNAEAIVNKVFSDRPVKKRIFKSLLRITRSHVSSRENLRYERTRAFGMVRKIVSAIGDQLNLGGLLEDSRDIFYLKLDEVMEMANGKNIPMNLKKVRKRKKEFNQYKKERDPSERFSTPGYNFGDSFIYIESNPVKSSNKLKGVGCCPGVVKDKVQVVNDPSDINSLNGKILVTRSTDPGWVKLFPTVSGILVEKGSLLSHSAIVSREMGIPCIVGITGLLKNIGNNTEVLMNGSTGEIEIF